MLVHMLTDEGLKSINVFIKHESLSLFHNMGWPRVHKKKIKIKNPGSVSSV